MRKYWKISLSFSLLTTSEIFAVKHELDLLHIRLGFEMGNKQQLSSSATGTKREIPKNIGVSTAITTALISLLDFSRFAPV